MSNTAFSRQSSQRNRVQVFINDELVMLEQSTLNALKVMAYDQGKTVEEIMTEAIIETMADPDRLAGLINRTKAYPESISH